MNTNANINSYYYVRVEGGGSGVAKHFETAKEAMLEKVNAKKREYKYLLKRDGENFDRSYLTTWEVVKITTITEVIENNNI